jgi:inosine/xanthosine triphosphate pyrophosphatase family protein
MDEIPSMDLRFLSKNDHKVAEFQKLFEATPYAIKKAEFLIDEIQTEVNRPGFAGGHLV